MIIYVIENKINGKLYVGQSRVSAIRRWRDHCADARTGMGHPLAAAIAKYSPEFFTLHTVDLGSYTTQETLDLVERRLIAHLGTLSPRGYNLCVGGNGGPIHIETREKISSALMGHGHSDETRRRISESKKGVKYGPQSPEHRAKIQYTRRNYIPSKEARERIAQSLRGRALPAAHVENIRAALTGLKHKPMSDEARARLSQLRRGKKRGPYRKVAA